VVADAVAAHAANATIVAITITAVTCTIIIITSIVAIIVIITIIITASTIITTTTVTKIANTIASIMDATADVDTEVAPEEEPLENVDRYFKKISASRIVSHKSLQQIMKHIPLFTV